MQNIKHEEQLRIIWEGSQLVHHSLALVNRELCLRLIKAGHELSLIPYEADQFDPGNDTNLQILVSREGAPLSGAVDIHVRHHWPPSFVPPANGCWVMIQPWEFGSLPVSWIDSMSNQVDEVWVPTSFVRESYIKSGIPADRVVVVPNGVDCTRFHPKALRMDFASLDGKCATPACRDSAFKFLFVGGTLLRKGIDLLLKAYLNGFTAADNVCLIIKDMGAQTFYKGQTWGEIINRIKAEPGAPAIFYSAENIPIDQLPSLYTASDCLVHPYRGEGFGLPIAEAMACGLPVIVTGYGAALDFCDTNTAYLIPASQKFGIDRQVGNLETVDLPWMGEPDIEQLIQLMHYVYTHRRKAKAMGKRAMDRIRSAFTWDHAAKTAIERLLILRNQTPRRQMI